MNHLRRKSRRREDSKNPPKRDVKNFDKEEDEENCYGACVVREKKRNFPVINKKWCWTCLLFLVLVDQAFFYIRYFTMSRPAWLYGSPTDPSTLKCLLKEPHAETPNVRWEWHHYNTTMHTPRRRLLIAQYSGFGTYSQLLERTARVNKAYAKRWGHDMVILQGTSVQFPMIDPTCDDAPRSTFDKITLLDVALQNKDKYKYVLILDTDAMLRQFDIDVTTLLPSTHLLAAHRVYKYDWPNTWDVNAGILLVNLHHSSVERVYEEWLTSVQHNPALVLRRNDDQYFLQVALIGLGFWNRYTYTLTHQFEYARGTVIQHFKRDELSWAGTLKQRLGQIDASIRDICQVWQDCQEPLIKYS